ncbi:MAG: hypothetical protein E7246_00380 [Lachnoclostridium sp.]|nr:hypothetical protein [Lachnoclostridium sp.]
MISYDALPVLLRIALMFGLFVVLCGSIHMLVNALQRRSFYFTIPILLCVVLSAGMMILYAADVRSEKKALAPAGVSRWFCEKPVIYVIIVLAVMAVFLAYLFLCEIRFRKTTLTRTAIKESIDHLPTGLCFYTGNGRVMLVNHRMNQLCHDTLGYDLQNAAQMWDDLCDGNTRPDIVRVSMGTQPSFRLPDGTVWSFSKTDLEDVFQLTAVDTTKLHGLAEELEQKNIALEALYQRLKQYEENVEELTRDKERLETKIGIHSELGQTLWAARSYLRDSKEETAIPIDAWKRSIALLRQNTVEKNDPFTLQILIQTANAFGITVDVDGQMPEQKEAEKLFLEAATEALTNAVRHADARTLYIRFFETNTDYLVCFQNDGKLPENKITEGGGLSSLRRKIETAGGSMQISCHPEYIVTVAIHKTGGESI